MYSEGLIKDKDAYEMGDIVIGKKPEREAEEERVFFCPVGLGADTVLIAYMVYEKAVKKGIGTKLKLWTENPWELLFRS